METKANEDFELTEEQKSAANKIFQKQLARQQRLLALYQELRDMIWDDLESDVDKELYRVICFCLYKLAAHHGPTQEYLAVFSNGFDCGDYPG